LGQFPDYLCLHFCTLFFGGHPKQQNWTPLVAQLKGDTAAIILDGVKIVPIQYMDWAVMLLMLTPLKIMAAVSPSISHKIIYSPFVVWSGTGSIGPCHVSGIPLQEGFFPFCKGEKPAWLEREWDFPLKGRKFPHTWHGPMSGYYWANVNFIFSKRSDGTLLGNQP
jgi:hypothetical protein